MGALLSLTIAIWVLLVTHNTIGCLSIVLKHFQNINL